MKYQFEMISSEMLDGHVERREGILIDLRDPKEYKKAHIRGAVNVPYEEASRLELYPPDQKLIIYCDRGGASLSVAKNLAAKGFRVYSLNGGIQGYRGRNLVKETKTFRNT